MRLLILLTFFTASFTCVAQSDSTVSAGLTIRNIYTHEQVLIPYGTMVSVKLPVQRLVGTLKPGPDSIYGTIYIDDEQVWVTDILTLKRLNIGHGEQFLGYTVIGLSGVGVAITGAVSLFANYYGGFREGLKVFAIGMAGSTLIFSGGNRIRGREFRLREASAWEIVSW